MRVKLQAFLVAAADLGVVAVNYIAPHDDIARPIVSIDAGSRVAAVEIAAAPGMPEPREVVYRGRRWLSSTVTEPELHLNVRSEAEDVALAHEHDGRPAIPAIATPTGGAS